MSPSVTTWNGTTRSARSPRRPTLPFTSSPGIWSTVLVKRVKHVRLPTVPPKNIEEESQSQVPVFHPWQDPEGRWTPPIPRPWTWPRPKLHTAHKPDRLQGTAQPEPASKKPQWLLGNNKGACLQCTCSASAGIRQLSMGSLPDVPDQQVRSCAKKSCSICHRRA